MAFTYSGNPSSSVRDETRFLLSDTASPWLFSDEEIDYALSKNSQEPWATAANLARVKASAFLRRGSISIDGISVDFGSRGRAMLELAEVLEREAKKSPTHALPVTVGGISKSFDVGLITPGDDYPSVFQSLDYPP